jgi:hypothetical protein
VNLHSHDLAAAATGKPAVEGAPYVDEALAQLVDQRGHVQIGAMCQNQKYLGVWTRFSTHEAAGCANAPQ